MRLHAESLKQAQFLARKNPQKPTQASLRRSVSAPYYALFRFQVNDATRPMFPSSAHHPLRNSLARASPLGHETDRRGIHQDVDTPKLASGLNNQPVQQELVDVATAFVQLHEACNDANYNRALRFTLWEAPDLADQADQAFRDWSQVRGSFRAEAFLTSLLAYRHIQG